MSHYFTNEEREHNYRQISYEVANKKFSFTTDDGVFSKDRVDYGTDVLLRAVIADVEARAEAGMSRSGESQDSSSRRFVDMGSGYGVVSVVLGELFGLEMTAVDVNENALELTRQNSEKARVDVEVYSRDKFDALERTFDGYVTNPPFRAGKDVVLGIIDDAYRRLESGGALYLVVQKKQGMPSYKKHMDALFGRVEVLLRDKGYYVLKSVR